MFKCNNCNCTFDEPIEIKTTYENYYGVGGLFPNHNYLTYMACPHCHEEEFEEVVEENEEK